MSTNIFPVNRFLTNKGNISDGAYALLPAACPETCLRATHRQAADRCNAQAGPSFVN
ncbi:MAG: hypothetical protein K8S14_07085 [Actinomycetia bacterium]|nr:hypothetical protein [Actinomycetes bacterium]